METKDLELTLKKVVRKETLNGKDWNVLRELLNTKFLFGKKKRLFKELLKTLYSVRDDKKLDEEMKLTKEYIEHQYIVMTYWKGNYEELEDIRLKRRSKEAIRK